MKVNQSNNLMQEQFSFKNFQIMVASYIHIYIRMIINIFICSLIFHFSR